MIKVGHSGIHLRCNPGLTKKPPSFYPPGKSYDVASPLLARVRSTLVRLHPGRRGSTASSAFATFRSICLKFYKDTRKEVEIFCILKKVGLISSCTPQNSIFEKRQEYE